MFQIHLKEMRPWGTTADGDPQGLIVHSIRLFFRNQGNRQ